MSTTPARRLLRRLINLPDGRMPLAEAALCIAWEDQGGADPRPALDALDAMAATLGPRLAAAPTPAARVAALSAHLADELGLRGNPHCYDRPDPADSFLDQVLARRMGLPILLTVVYLEVGWRLGLPLEGVGLPGHFIARYRDGGEDLYFDPYDGGRLWSYEDCLRQIAIFQSDLSPELIAEVLSATSRQAIIERILRNLKNTYLAQRDYRRALATSERLLLLAPGAPAELRDRGLLRLRTGQVSGALADLERYAALAPNAPDLFDLRAFARSVLDSAAPLN